LRKLWDHGCMHDTILMLNERDLFENVLESPDKNGQLLTIFGNLNNFIESKYYNTIKQSSTCFKNLTQDAFQYLITVIFGA